MEPRDHIELNKQIVRIRRDHREIKKPEHLSQVMEDHGTEGMTILLTSSSVSASFIIYLLTSLFIAAIVWSFIGKADIIVTAEGQLEPMSEMRRVYVPIAGELADIVVTEGMDVAEGDIIARIKAPNAIKIAADASQAKLQLEQIETEIANFPLKKRLIQDDLLNIHEQIKQKKIEYEQLKNDRYKNIPDSHYLKIEKLKLQLQESEKAKEKAKNLMIKYKKLYESEGHGGISKKEADDKETEYLKLEMAVKSLTLDLDHLEIEYSQEVTQADKKFAEVRLTLQALEVQYNSKKMELEHQELTLNLQYRSAKAAYDAASLIKIDDLDKDNLIIIRSPVSGVITKITAEQKGEKIKEDIPLASISPNDAAKVVKIYIPDKDRGLLTEGQSVKLKFAAFPFHRYGFIPGILEYISPAALPSKQGELFYEGRVSVKKEYVAEEGKRIPLRYGMTATAEIVIQQRRLIDMVLDPLRKLKPT